MDEAPIKLDERIRTTAQGFSYANEDPANSRDRTPTTLSYIDFVFAGQLEKLDRDLLTATGAARRAAERRRQALLESIAERKRRVHRGRALFVIPESSEDEPLGGIELSYLIILILFMTYSLLSASTLPWIPLLGLFVLTMSFLIQNYDLDPYGGLED